MHHVGLELNVCRILRIAFFRIKVILIKVHLLFMQGNLGDELTRKIMCQHIASLTCHLSVGSVCMCGCMDIHTDVSRSVKTCIYLPVFNALSCVWCVCKFANI